MADTGSGARPSRRSTSTHVVTDPQTQAPEDRPFIAINAAWLDGAETVDALVAEFQAAR